MSPSPSIQPVGSQQNSKPAVHELKCWPQFFKEIAAGKKRHDLRRADDRKFLIGDHLLLREFSPETSKYTGREQLVEVTYITSAELPCALSEGALHKGFCILSIRPIEKPRQVPH